VIGKYVENIEDIKDGDTYVVLTQNDGLVYKRLYNTVEADGTIQFHSDNKSYLPYHIKPEDIYEVWHFVCSLNPTDRPISDLLYNAIQDIQNSLVGFKLEGRKAIQP
jgi:hypothetical protein